MLLGQGRRDTPELHIQGSRLLYNGSPILLRGVSVPTLESSNSGEHVFRSCRVAIEDWKANCIRLPVCQDRWFGKAPDQEGKGDDYRNSIDEIATYLSRSNCFLILDLQWSDAGVWGKNLSNHKMPDRNSEAFWKEAAHKFRGNQNVIFDLYDSPHDIPWEVWRRGGWVQEEALIYKSIGFEQLLKDVRGTGAKNVVIVGGTEEFNHSTPTNPFADFAGSGLLFEKAVRFSAPTDPGIDPEQPTILRTPEGEASTPGDLSRLLGWATTLHLNWTVGSMRPGSSTSLVRDWIYTPTEDWGALVKQTLSKLVNP